MKINFKFAEQDLVGDREEDVSFYFIFCNGHVM